MVYLSSFLFKETTMMNGERRFTVYMHVCPNNKKYIGITGRKPEERWHGGNGYSNQLFGNAIKKYGWENIEHVIITEGLTETKAAKIEKDWIKYWDTINTLNGYNVSIGGTQTSLGCTFSKQALINLSNPIYQFDRQGNFIKEWFGAGEAMHTLGIDSSAIIKCCRKKIRRTNSYTWRYKNDPMFSKYEPNSVQVKNIIKEELKITRNKKYCSSRYNSCGIKINQYTIDGIFIKEWESSKQINRVLGFDNSYIMKCCKGKAKTSHGYKWEYKDINNQKLVKTRRDKEVCQYSLENKFIKKWNNSYEIQNQLGLKINSILSACERKNGKSQGYRWKYTNKEKTNE